MARRRRLGNSNVFFPFITIEHRGVPMLSEIIIACKRCFRQHRLAYCWEMALSHFNVRYFLSSAVWGLGGSRDAFLFDGINYLLSYFVFYLFLILLYSALHEHKRTRFLWCIVILVWALDNVLELWSLIHCDNLLSCVVEVRLLWRIFGQV